MLTLPRVAAAIASRVASTMVGGRRVVVEQVVDVVVDPLADEHHRLAAAVAART